MSKWPQWLRGLCDLRVTLENAFASRNESFWAPPQNKHPDWNNWANPGPWAWQAPYRSHMPWAGGTGQVGAQLAEAVFYHGQWWHTSGGHKQARTSDRGPVASGEQSGGLLLRQPPISVQRGQLPYWRLSSDDSRYPTPTAIPGACPAAAP